MHFFPLAVRNCKLNSLKSGGLLQTNIISCNLANFSEHYFTIFFFHCQFVKVIRMGENTALLLKIGLLNQTKVWKEYLVKQRLKRIQAKYMSSKKNIKYGEKRNGRKKCWWKIQKQQLKTNQTSLFWRIKYPPSPKWPRNPIL